MSITKIKQTLRQSFVDGSFGLPIVTEGTSYTPTQGAAYVELIVANNDISPLDWAHTNETDGVFRLILRYPTTATIADVESKAQQIQEYYSIGREFAYNGQAAIVRSYKEDAGVAEDGWRKLVISIMYRAYLAR